MSASSPLTTHLGRSVELPYAAQISLKDLPGSELPWLVEGRNAAMSRFVELGLPSQKIEDWKYSNLTSLAKIDFTNPDRTAVEMARDKIERRFSKKSDAARLVFVNGSLDATLSALEKLPVGVRVLGLADAVLQENDLLKTQLKDMPVQNDHALAFLNTALMEDGCLVVLEPKTEAALELLFVAASDGGVPAYHPRISIFVGVGSHLSLSEQHATLGEHEYWSNPVADICLGKNARMCHYSIQGESSQAWQTYLTKVRARSGASYENFIVATGGRYTRNEIEVALEGEGANCDLGGGFLLAGDQQIDNRLCVDHMAPYCVSRQAYKGVLDDRAHGVFQGKTVVRRDAQKTDGNQLSRALLLSPDAVMDAKPELEIYADDVKCSHGATVGELDGDQMFYMQARGIDEVTARNLLVAAFIEEHVQSISNEAARDWLAEAVTGWLARRKTEEAA